MAEEAFETNLMRMIAAGLHFLIGMTAAREMFGKSYFSLGLAEKTAVDQSVFGMIASNYQALTPAFLAAPQSQQGCPCHGQSPTTYGAARIAIGAV
jgi:hypothetical protein